METQAGSLLTSPVGASKIPPSSSFHPFPHSTLASFSLYHLLVHSFKEYLSSAILVSEIAKKKNSTNQVAYPTQVHSLMVLEAGSLKSRGPRAMLSAGSRGECSEAPS